MYIPVLDLLFHKFKELSKIKSLILTVSLFLISFRQQILNIVKEKALLEGRAFGETLLI